MLIHSFIFCYKCCCSIWVIVICTHGLTPAKISTICITLTGFLSLFMIPSICIRHDISAPVIICALEFRWSLILSFPIATETASSATLNVPPKPQHSSSLFKVISSILGTFSKRFFNFELYGIFNSLAVASFRTLWPWQELWFPTL